MNIKKLNSFFLFSFFGQEYPGRQISIQASYLEIYDEEIHDLLSMEPFHGEITVQEDQNVQLYVVFGFNLKLFTKYNVYTGRNHHHWSNTNGMSYN